MAIDKSLRKRIAPWQILDILKESEMDFNEKLQTLEIVKNLIEFAKEVEESEKSSENE